LESLLLEESYVVHLFFRSCREEHKKVASLTRHALRPEEISRFNRDGYTVRESVFTDDELEGLREAIERAASKAVAGVVRGKTYLLDGKRFVDIDGMTIQFEHALNSDTPRVIEPIAGLEPKLGELLRDTRLVDPMRQLVGTDEVAIWTNKLNLKRPREGTGFGWHQDSPYWVHNCAHVDQLPNVMLAFDTATLDNGCLRVIPGSHRHGCLPGISNGTSLGGFFTSDSCFDESQQVPLPVAAGSLIFFSPHLVHGSQSNHSDQPRRAIIVTYQPAGQPTLKTGEVLNV
jgi:ectoine hydroxylase-related dioxygenase (phytanoyl-CoA dioxygenase family)